ncbi:MAG: hypothetical protein N2C14_08025, partial [Planctomycetales bacterium]
MENEQPLADNSPKPRGRFLTYTLRSLAALMFVSCVGFTWFGVVWLAKQMEREAVHALKQNGASIWYDYHLGKGGVLLNPPPNPPGPAWQHALLGDDWFATPQVVRFNDEKKVNDEQKVTDEN